MSDVVNRTTTGSPPVGTAIVDYRQSVNTPEFPPANWIINPDLSAVTGLARRYWKIVGGAVLAMTGPEQTSVDAAAAFNGQIDIAYAAAIDIDMRTVGALYSIGALTGPVTFSFINFFPGAQATIYVRQDAGGANGVSFTAPGGWTIQLDENLVDTEAGQTGDQVTGYAVSFTQVGGLSLLHIGKTILN